MTCQRQPDAYVPPRYPVDEPPTYRAQCSCGWVGPERYRGITDTDWREHTEGGSVNDDDELREAINAAADEWARNPGVTDSVADAVLALPEIAALRAKAHAADRVRAMIEAPTWDVQHGGLVDTSEVVEAICRVLDGDQS